MLILCFKRHSEKYIAVYVIAIICNALQIMNLFFLQVLRPCSVKLETKMPTNAPFTGSVTVEEVIVKVGVSSLSY